MSDGRSQLRSLRSFLALASAGLLVAAPAVADDAVERFDPRLDYAPVVVDDTLAGADAALDFASPAPAAAAAEVPAEPAEPVAEVIAEGEASYYGKRFAGNRTANGERFDPMAMTAAHRTLPMGSKLRVTNLKNGRKVVVRINDRGPYHGKRILDVSLAAAQQIGMVRPGKALVKLELLR